MPDCKCCGAYIKWEDPAEWGPRCEECNEKYKLYHGAKDRITELEAECDRLQIERDMAEEQLEACREVRKKRIGELERQLDTFMERIRIGNEDRYTFEKEVERLGNLLIDALAENERLQNQLLQTTSDYVALEQALKK